MARSSSSRPGGGAESSGWQEHDGWLPGIYATFVEEPRQRRSIESTLQVLAAAEEVLGEQGAQGLTMQAVAKRAGVSVGGIYGRFDGKAGLLIAVKDLLLSRMEADLDERLQACTSLYGVVRELVDCISTHLSRPAVNAVATATGERQAEMAARGLLAWERTLETFTRAATAHGSEIRHEDPKTALRTVRDIVLATIVTTGTSKSPSVSISSGRQKIELTRALYLYLSSPASDGPKTPTTGATTTVPPLDAVTTPPD